MLVFSVCIVMVIVVFELKLVVVKNGLNIMFWFILLMVILYLLVLIMLVYINFIEVVVVVL